MDVAGGLCAWGCDVLCLELETAGEGSTAKGGQGGGGIMSFMVID